MIASTHCPLCHSKNNGPWMLISLDGENKKVCKLCVDKNVVEPFDLTLVQQTKERVEAQR